MAALRYNLRIRQGSTWSLVVPVKNEDGSTADLTGSTAKAQVRGFYDGDTALHEWSTTEGNLTLGSGNITLSVPAATSAEWEWRFGRWDLELTAASGVVTPLIAGGFVFVEPETTQ